MDADGWKKYQALYAACRDIDGVFFRTFIVAEDGKVDILEDDNHDGPHWLLEGLRPGLWRTYSRFEDHLADFAAFWCIWVCDGRSLDLLDQMAGVQKVGDEMRDVVKSRTQGDYAVSLNWQVEEKDGPGMDEGIALRSRHVLSPELYAYLHGKTIEKERGIMQDQWKQLPKHWRNQLEIWFSCQDSIDITHDEMGGIVVGGAQIGTGIERGGFDSVSYARNEQGQIVGILLGNMFESKSEEHYDIVDYDVVSHEEALGGIDPGKRLRPVTLTCIHGGDDGLEMDTPSYLPAFEITLDVEDLCANTSAATIQHIGEHLKQHRHLLFNPYVDVSAMLERDSTVNEIIRLDVKLSFWTSLRSKASSKPASIIYHLPCMLHAAQSSTPPMTMRDTSKVTEWIAPNDWHHPIRPSICTSDQYRLVPVFRYVGCGYALTPTSSYPPTKASEVWRWVAEPAAEEDRGEEAYYDPYGAHYRIGRQSEKAIDVLGHTAMFLDSDGQPHFADVFGVDVERGLLFGWLRVKSPHNKSIDAFSAFALPGHAEIFGSPFFETIQVQRFGFPQVIPSPSSLPEDLHVPILCRQAPNRDSPNLVPELVIQVPISLAKKLNIGSYILDYVLSRLLQDGLLHPLFVQALQNFKKKNRGVAGPIIFASGHRRKDLAMDAYIRRGQAPAGFGLTVPWTFQPDARPEYCEPLNCLQMPRLRRQPIDNAWKAPQHWFEPVKPTIDPLGEYQAVDVMSYVGCGYVLPPWSTYPPDRAKFVWSRLFFGDESKESGVFDVRRMHRARCWSPSSLLDVLGQTVMFDTMMIADVVAVDQVRGLIFGFSRLNARGDKFYCFRVKKYLTNLLNQGLSVSPLPNPGLEIIDCSAIGLPILNLDIPLNQQIVPLFAPITRTSNQESVSSSETNAI